MNAHEIGVEVDAVTFSYGRNTILDAVSLAVPKGEFFAFLGPSGSGKTTLLRLIAGFGTPQQGRISVGGRDVTAAPPWDRNVGMVFQNYALWPHMTVAENVAFGLHRRRVPAADVARRVADALELVGLAGYGGRRPAQLSGGQQQRVALARTVVIEPEVLLLDEPLSNLDAQLRVEMRGELRALQRKTGLTTIFVTHDQEEANAICDRMAVLDGGRIQQVGRPVELYDNPANRFVAGFLGTANLIEGEVARDGAGFVFRSAQGFVLPAPEGATPGRSLVALRPQAMTIMRDGGPAAIAGEVRRTEFLGGHVRYAIEAHGLVFHVDEPHLRGREALPPGTAVRLVADPEQLTFLAP
ncbi:MAG: ABC transporter ATP-binding protein [Acetobacteraceae bacterium]|jgi:iron(III) transport system ATP-binding protein|nr:ABC transporter ATP-binding protein [Acetobacteraceae bacterium]